MGGVEMKKEIKTYQNSAVMTAKFTDINTNSVVITTEIPSVIEFRQSQLANLLNFPLIESRYISFAHYIHINVHRMMQFAQTFPDFQIVSTLLSKLKQQKRIINHCLSASAYNR